MGSDGHKDVTFLEYGSIKAWNHKFRRTMLPTLERYSEYLSTMFEHHDERMPWHVLQSIPKWRFTYGPIISPNVYPVHNPKLWSWLCTLEPYSAWATSWETEMITHYSLLKGRCHKIPKDSSCAALLDLDDGQNDVPTGDGSVHHGICGLCATG